jgi:hypothetical protein
VIVTVQRETVSMDSQRFESAEAVEGKVRIKMDKSSFDAIPSLCRRLNPPMLATGVCEDSVMVGYPADNDGLVLYRILVSLRSGACAKRTS